jgi:predicted dehydrogenase
MFKVKIYGAGSIGCHLAFSCRHMGMDVLVTDIDHVALERMKNDIYPARYGAWDDAIALSESDVHGEWDLVIIGTPPNNHIDLALHVFTHDTTRALLIEKPLCPPDLSELLRLQQVLASTETKVFIGYNHTLTKNTQQLRNLIEKENTWGCLKSANVFIKEHWKGIFAAHPWLAGPEDSYLGHVEKGGGATCEHSHGINLLQYFLHLINGERIERLSAIASWVSAENIQYDESVLINGVTNTGTVIHIQQDVITEPSIKKAFLQFENAQVQWITNKEDGLDSIVCLCDGTDTVYDVQTTRPDDFHPEIKHIRDVLNEGACYETSPIHIQRGIETMIVICAIFRAHEEKRCVRIQYEEKDLDKIITLE